MGGVRGPRDGDTLRVHHTKVKRDQFSIHLSGSNNQTASLTWNKTGMKARARIREKNRRIHRDVFKPLRMYPYEDCSIHIARKEKEFEHTRSKKK